MQLFKLALFSLVFCSCISSRPVTKSNWSVLEKSKLTDCEVIPKKKGDFAILDIQPFQGNFKISEGLLFNAQQRKGLKYNYLSPVDGTDLNLDKSHDFIWGSGANYLGSIDIEGKTHIVVEALDKANFKRVEIRSINDNIVRFASKRLPYSFRGMKVFPSKQGLWITFKHAKSQTSMDDLPTEIVEASYAKDEKLSLNLAEALKIPGEVRITGFGVGKLATFFAQQLPGKVGRVKLSYTIFDSLKSKPDVLEYGDDSIDRLESWNVSAHRDGVVLVFVSGDTLIWENAKLDVVSFDQAGDVSWTESFPIEGEHVGEPHLVQQGAATYLVQPKWLDSESSLHVSEIGRSKVKDLGYHGVFNEGTFLYKVFGQKNDKSLFMISRYPDGFGKAHSLCEIEI